MQVYIVQALGTGDDEDAWENVCAFSVQCEADAHAAQLASYRSIQYRVEPVTLH